MQMLYAKMHEWQYGISIHDCYIEVNFGHYQWTLVYDKSKFYQTHWM